MNGVSISDMQNFVENMDDMKLSSGIGNVIELGDEDLGDNFGADLLSNSRVSARPASSGFSSQSVHAFEKIDDIGIGRLEPLESISFDIPMNSNNPVPEVIVNRDSSSIFSNDQSASGPSINLAGANRINPEDEKKKKSDLINKLNTEYAITAKFEKITSDTNLFTFQTKDIGPYFT